MAVTVEPFSPSLFRSLLLISINLILNQCATLYSASAIMSKAAKTSGSRSPPELPRDIKRSIITPSTTSRQFKILSPSQMPTRLQFIAQKSLKNFQYTENY